MKDTLLMPEKDPMGRAIWDYYTEGKAARLRVFSSLFEEDEIPVSVLFRKEKDMPVLECKALDECKGKVLDVGAGAGCHALVLQERGREVTAIDISSLSVEVMSLRGVKDARQVDLFEESFVGTFDTVLMLMNGSGVIGGLHRMTCFFRQMKRLLAPGGCVLVDSSDLRYVFEDEDGGMDIDLNARYYGEVDFNMRYKDVKGDSFNWLYIDFDTLAYYAHANGFTAELLAEGEHYDYLARLTYGKEQ